MRPLKEGERRKYGLEPGLGVAIKALDKDGPLESVGFEKDDVVLDINTLPVQGVEGFAALVKSIPPRRQVLLKALDHRTGRSGLVRVTLS